MGAVAEAVAADSYHQFLAAKKQLPEPLGFDAEIDNAYAFDWQRDVVQWACKRGRASLFEAVGLGKTLQELLWAEAVVKHSGGKVLILCPIAVAGQTQREAAKFDITVPVNVRRRGSEVTDGITITNYEKLHLFDASEFVGVVLNEASILKSYMGTRKRQLIEAFRETPYRLTETATPAPNDLKELGNQAEFLGIMRSNEMLMRWFQNDTMEAGGYTLKPHAANDFWEWVASWAVCLSRPSDLGDYSDDGYILPGLEITEHIIEDPPTERKGQLFGSDKALSATNLHRHKRLTSPFRASKVAELVNGSDEAWAVWCDTDYEQDALIKLLPGCVEVRGSTPEAKQEAAFFAFANGDARVIVTKPSIAGLGLNWQHCRNMAFVGLSYSFESYHQAIGRMLRFGQRKTVRVHVVASETEASIGDVVAGKEAQFLDLRTSMAAAMKRFQEANIAGGRRLKPYKPAKAMKLPAWLQTKG